MKDISRRDFLKILGAGTVATAATMAGCKNDSELDPKGTIKPQKGQMTYRTNPKTGDKVSLLGFGMMRLPVIEEDGPSGASGREVPAPIDQEMVNKMVDKAIEYGVNYFDTSRHIARDAANMPRASPCRGTNATNISSPPRCRTSRPAPGRVRNPSKCSKIP